MKEFELINLIKNIIPESSKYIGDDTAYLQELGIVITTDTLVEDVHFRLKNTSAFDLGYKALAVNLSDIASDGAIPAYAFVALSLPNYVDEIFVQEFYEGLKELALRYGVIIAGGDITKGSKLFINITLIGKTMNLQPARRGNAKKGDIIVATGFYGSSKAGLEILENEANFIKTIPSFILEKFKKAHRKPEPHLGFGRIILQNSYTTPAMMDTSDGLADALFKIAQSSSVEIEIDANLIPMDPDLKNVAEICKENPLEWALFGGEDYTLVAAIENDTAEKLAKKNIPIRKLGKVINVVQKGFVRIETNSKTVLLTQDIIENKTFNHFV